MSGSINLSSVLAALGSLSGQSASASASDNTDYSSIWGGLLSGQDVSSMLSSALSDTGLSQYSDLLGFSSMGPQERQLLASNPMLGSAMGGGLGMSQMMPQQYASRLMMPQQQSLMMSRYPQMGMSGGYGMSQQSMMGMPQQMGGYGMSQNPMMGGYGMPGGYGQQSGYGAMMQPGMMGGYGMQGMSGMQGGYGMQGMSGGYGMQAMAGGYGMQGMGGGYGMQGGAPQGMYGSAMGGGYGGYGGYGGQQSAMNSLPPNVYGAPQTMMGMQAPQQISPYLTSSGNPFFSAVIS